MFIKDYKDQEFERLVILGESTVQGGPWLAKEEQRFADVLVQLINLCQSKPVEYFNEGIGASVISPQSPGYERSGKPSALERYRERVIDRGPDLFILCYGMNDMRAGYAVDKFSGDMEKIISDTKAACNPVTVLTTVYHMTGFDYYEGWDCGSIKATETYNAAISDLAQKYDCILADVWSAEGFADHVIHQDGVHANAVGNLLIAHRLFEAIAQNCTGLSRHTRELDEMTEWTRTIRPRG